LKLQALCFGIAEEVKPQDYEIVVGASFGKVDPCGRAKRFWRSCCVIVSSIDNFIDSRFYGAIELTPHWRHIHFLLRLIISTQSALDLNRQLAHNILRDRSLLHFHDVVVGGRFCSLYLLFALVTNIVELLLLRKRLLEGCELLGGGRRLGVEGVGDELSERFGLCFELLEALVDLKAGVGALVELP
jgi:hypothetical protein